MKKKAVGHLRLFINLTPPESPHRICCGGSAPPSHGADRQTHRLTLAEIRFAGWIPRHWLAGWLTLMLAPGGQPYNSNILEYIYCAYYVYCQCGEYNIYNIHTYIVKDSACGGEGSDTVPSHTYRMWQSERWSTAEAALGLDSSIIR